MTITQYQMEYCTHSDDTEEGWEDLGWFNSIRECVDKAHEHGKDRKAITEIVVAQPDGSCEYGNGSYVIYPPEFWNAI